MRRVLVCFGLVLGSLLVRPAPVIVAQEATPAAAPALAEFVRDVELGTGPESAPEGVAVAADGTLYVVEALQDRIRVFDAAGDPVATFGERGEGPGQFKFEEGGFYWGDLAIGPDGNLYVLDPFNGRVQVLAPDGTYLREFGEPGEDEGQLAEPTGIAIDRDGRVYVTEFGQNRLQVFDPDGRSVAAWDLVAPGGRPVRDATDVAVDAAGTVWVADYGDAQVYRLGADGVVRDAVLEHEPGQLLDRLTPWGAAVDAAGNLYVAGFGGGGVQVFAPDGTRLGTVGEVGFGTGQMMSPVYLTVAPDGLLYVADEGTRRVLVFHLLAPLGAIGGTPVPA